MKHIIGFTLLFLCCCSDPDPDIASFFVGTYICEQQTGDELISTEWKIWQDGYKDRVKIRISIRTDFKQADKQDITQSFSVDSVLVESKTVLYFNNEYVGEKEVMIIKGQAIKEGQSLSADIALINEKGVVTNQILEFAKKRWN